MNALELAKNPFNINYFTAVIPYSEIFTHVKLSNDKINQLKLTVSDIIQKKKDESHHIIDSEQEEKRWLTGLSGEAVIEKYLGLNFSDITIGESNDYNFGDLKKIGVNCGVKSVEYKKFPLIKKPPKTPEIIVMKYNDNNYYVCGLATKAVLSNYTADNLVLDENVLRRGKTGFWGFQALKTFKNFDELKFLVDNDK